MSLARRLLPLTLVLCGGGAAQAEPAASEPAVPAWCAEGTTALDAGTCYFEPAAAATEAPTTLIVFLHSLVRANSDWQYEQQRLMMRTASAMNVAVLMPRGRVGIGPGQDPRTVAWPGSPRTQELYEAAVLAEWDRARAAIETTRGQRFSRVLIFGFSNGAYYATTLAVRQRYPADGYGLFAGGSGSKYNRLLANRSGAHVPVFVGYGTKDPAAADMRSLARMLGDLGWPHQVKAANIGHWVSDAQLQSAIRFLVHSSSER
ncbi:MAG TPA: hypothetical protein VI197_08275 [Polyangiaceae bacterium]